MIKKISVFVGILLLIIFIILLVNNFSNQEVSEQTLESTKEVVHEPSNLSQVKMLSSKERIEAANQKIIDEYKAAGEHCKLIGNLIERGDCFQEVNANHLMINLRDDKTIFFFPHQSEDTIREDKLHFLVDENDQLIEAEPTEYIAEFSETTFGKASVQRGQDIVSEYWHIFSNIIPKEYRESLKHVYWLDTGIGNFSFTYGREVSNVEESRLSFSQNTEKYTTDQKTRLIHEFAHVFILDDDQGKIYEEIYLSEDEEVWEAAAANCPTYFSWGCMNESSYMNAYYDLFWEDIWERYTKIDWNAQSDFKLFFRKYEDRFFNTYQATLPEEDIAEALVYFVLLSSEDSKDKVEMKYDKVQFFYKYDEMIKIRADIQESIYDLVIADKRFY